jgi:integrase
MGRAATGTIRKLPSGRWQARFTFPDGRRHAAPTTFQTKRDANAWLHQQDADVSRGLWKPTTAGSSVAVEFRDYADRWLARRKVRGRDLSPRTRALYDDLLLRFILPTFGGRPVHLIAREDVEDWYDRTAPKRPTRRSQSYSLLRSILNTAVDDGYLSINPARIRGAGQTERRHLVRPATLDELVTITEAMPPRLQLLVQLAGWCGLRYGELIELRRGDVDTREGVLRVRRSAVLVNHPRTENRPAWSEVIVKPPKSSAGVRDVVIPRDLMDMVRMHLLAHTAPGPDGLLFPAVDDPTRHMKPSTLAKTYFKSREKAGRPDLRFHDLRHTSAVLAAQSGATLAELMERLGHSTSAAAMRYQHAAEGRSAVIADRLSELRAAHRIAGESA